MGKFLATWGALLAFVIIGIGAAINFERQVQERTRAELAMCERIKHDRVDNARALTAIAKYYNGVITAKSVESDVKEHAQKVQNLVFESANQLRSRILLCEPLIKDNKSILDERLWREAQGRL